MCIFNFEPTSTTAQFLATRACSDHQQCGDAAIADNAVLSHSTGTFHSDGRRSTLCRGTMVMLGYNTGHLSNVSEAHPNVGDM